MMLTRESTAIINFALSKNRNDAGHFKLILAQLEIMAFLRETLIDCRTRY